MNSSEDHLDEHGSITMACLSLSTIHFSKIAGSSVKNYFVENPTYMHGLHVISISSIRSGNLLVSFFSLSWVGSHFPFIALKAFK